MKNKCNKTFDSRKFGLCDTKFGYLSAYLVDAGFVEEYKDEKETN